MPQQELLQQRALVIEKAICIEHAISVIITKHYLGDTYAEFIAEVLYDDNFYFGLKRKILCKFLSEFEGSAEYNDLCRIMKIRNRFAHCSPDVLTLDHKSSGTRVPDPARPNKHLDFQSLYEEFEKIADRLIDFFRAKLIAMEVPVHWLEENKFTIKLVPGLPGNQ